MSYAKWAYEEKEQRLIKLEETADCIREDMDDLWREMTDEERELTNKLPKELSERWNKYKVKADAAEARDARWQAAMKAVGEFMDNFAFCDDDDYDQLAKCEKIIEAMATGSLEDLEKAVGTEVK